MIRSIDRPRRPGNEAHGVETLGNSQLGIGMLHNNPSILDRREFLKAVGTAAAVAAVPAFTAAGGVFPRTLSDKVVRVGVVGGNFGSTFHWHLDPNCKVSAVSDLRDDRLERLVKVYGPAKQYKSFLAFLKHPEPDAVAVFTPAPLHMWMATEAMKAGKHVIAGMSAEELELLLETVKKTGMKYMIAETSCYRSQVITCLEWAGQGKLGTIFYTEAEYHHEGLLPLSFDERGFPTWRYGFPPMHYPTHSTGLVVPITGEHLVEVQAVGWGDGHEVLATNEYGNPFWDTTAFFKTSGGHCSRISIFWHVAGGGAERGSIYGTLMSYIMERPEGTPDTVMQISNDGRTVIDANEYPEGKVGIDACKEPTHWEVLPPSL